METLTRLVTESLARHGLDRPSDHRRLRWSAWFRCESHHSLLLVPSKPGVVALAEQVIDFPSAALSEASGSIPEAERRKPEARRMLAVGRFFEDDDMAFVLDRMLSHENPMCARLGSGRYFVRFVVIEDAFERRSVSNALNQWLLCSAEKSTGIGSNFATSLELTPEPPGLSGTQSPESANSTRIQESAPRLNSAIGTTIHCSSSFPSGF